MSHAPRPWANLTVAEKKAAVLPLEADGQAPSGIAWKLKADPKEVSRICSLIRREREARGEEHPSPVLAEPADAVVAAGNDLREPAATVPGQIIREGDAPRETGRCTGGDASCPDTEYQGKPLRPVDGPEAQSRDRAGLPADSRAGDRRPWAELPPAGKRAHIKRLFLESKGYAEIARILGAPNRNTVVGYVNRLRSRGELPAATAESKRQAGKLHATKRLNGSNRTKAARVARAQSLLPQNIANKAESRKHDPAVPVAITRAAAWDPLPGCDPVPFGSPGCKWPVDGWEGRGLLWCGQPRDLDCGPYCTAHAAIAYTPPTSRIRTPANA